MVAASLTYPLLGYRAPAPGSSDLGDGTLEHTVLTVLGVHSNWLAALPILLAIGGAIAFAVRATPATSIAHPRDTADRARRDRRLGAWSSSVAPGDQQRPDHGPQAGGWQAFWLIGIGAVAALIAVSCSRGSAATAARSSAVARLALGDRTS